MFLQIFSIGDDGKFKNEKGKYIYHVFNTKKGKNVKVGRYDYYIQNLIPKHEDYGYSLVILYDENNKPVYASTYNEETKDIFLKLENSLKE